MNTFDEVKERAEQDGTEWTFGAIQSDLALIPLEVRLQYAPEGVKQFNNIMDTNGCASRSPLNVLETKFTYFYQTTMHPTLKKWLEDNKYVVNGKVVFNDAFIEILSGTTQQGNSLKMPIDTIRKQGLIPAYMLPLEDNMTWEQYMDKGRITKAMYDLAEAFKKRFTINYEQVSSDQFLNALKVDFLSVAGFAWPTPVNGVYQSTSTSFNHAFATVDPTIHALDNYEPYVKQLAPTYTLFEWGYALSVPNQNPAPEEQVMVFETLAKYGLLSFFLDWLIRFTNSVKGIWKR